MSLLGVAFSLMTKKSSSEDLAQVYIVPLKKDGSPDTDIGVWALQYWPEQVQLTSGIEYATKNIVGGSHPLYQWICSTERVLSFTAEFSRDLQGDIVDKSFIVPPGKVVRDRFNVDISQAIIWLESLKFASYGAAFGPAGFDPPPQLWLCLPKSKLGRAWGGGCSDVIQCVMTGFGPVVIDAWFPDGTIRHATIPLAFAEVVQTKDGITWADRSQMSMSENGGQAYKVAVAKRIDQ